MPSNSQGTIAIVAVVRAEVFYDFSTQDTYAALSLIPPGGTTLFLPADPSDGDSYEFADADGSCSAAKPIVVRANGGLTVMGSASRSFTTPNASSKFVFISELKTWVAFMGNGSAGQSFLSVQNEAALTALDVTGIPSGAIAYMVTHDGTYWSLGGPRPLVPSLIIAASDGRTWERFAQAKPTSAQEQVTWWVDLRGTLPTSSDQNDGLTAGTALLTKAEIARRWGSWAPRLDGIAVQVNFLGNDVDGSDPWLAEPILTGGASLGLVGTAPVAAFTGTLLAVTAKARASNQALESTFTTTSGALASNMRLVNTTRGNSVAYAVRDTGGGNWLLSQPFAPPPIGSAALVEVDTWANGDAIEGFTLQNVAIGRVMGINSDATSPALGHFVVRCALPAFSGNDPVELGQDVQSALVECIVNRDPISQPEGFLGPVLANCYVNGILTSGGGIAGAHISGGVYAGFLAFLGGGEIFDQDVVLEASTIFSSAGVTFGNVFGDGSAMSLSGNNVVQGGSVLYGTMTISIVKGDVLYPPPAATSLVGVTPRINGSLVGYSNLTGGGGVVTVHGGIALTPANMDAPAGAAGFGGLAYIPGIGSFTVAGAAP